MDLQMPVMDGYEATAIIRNLPNEKQNSLPIIALTASALFEMKEKVMGSGMNDFVSKPFKPDELFECICRYVKPVAED
jgi:CheY-like chemotaxis protein